MRIILSTTPNSKTIAFNYQPNLVGAFHKWLGKNNSHDDVSLYSLSWLAGGKANTEGLNFKYGASWTISSYESEVMKKLIKGIQSDPALFYGMTVKEVVILEEPNFSSIESFRLLSPIFIKRNIDGRSKYFLYNDKEASDLLTETIKTKLKKAGLNDQNVSVTFDENYHSPQTKMVDYKGIKCKASMCPVIIKGTPEQIAFAWNVGIGNSTGIGFGALK